MEGVFELFNLPVGNVLQKGIATLSTYEVSEQDAMWANLRLVRDSGWLFRIQKGKYIKLIVGKELMMSDTPMERSSNIDFVRAANGHVFVAGLGIGLIINALRPLVTNGKVSKITILEKYQDVIDLVSPIYNGMPIEYICADVLEFQPDKSVKYDTIYFDIWPDISEDNLPEITKLHNRFKFLKNKNNPNSWMGSWMQKYLQDKRKRENRYSYW